MITSFRNLNTFILTLFIFLFPYIAFSQCIDEESVKNIVDDSLSLPIKGIEEGVSVKDAYCIQSLIVDYLKQKGGKIVGYKVGFTGKNTQERFKISKPAYGVLFLEMFIKNGGNIASDFGYRPLIEPDLMVIVKDDKIMTAKNIIEVAKYLDTVHAFIELPSLRFEKGENITGARLIAANMLATKMVMGTGVKVEASQVFIDSLKNMDAIFYNQSGDIIQSAKGSALLGNPLNVVLWLVNELNNNGKNLKKGDRISLGSVGKLFPIISGEKYIYKLEGLPNGSSKVEIDVN